MIRARRNPILACVCVSLVAQYVFLCTNWEVVQGLCCLVDGQRVLHMRLFSRAEVLPFALILGVSAKPIAPVSVNEQSGTPVT